MDEQSTVVPDYLISFALAPGLALSHLIEPLIPKDVVARDAMVTPTAVGLEIKRVQ